MLGGADNPNGELPSYITGADTCSLYTQSLALKVTGSFKPSGLFPPALQK